MSEQEHPAAKAGRFVRAAGLAISRELEKQAAKPPRTPRASTAPPAQAAPVVQAAPAPPPPALPTGGFVGRLVFYAFVLSLFAFVFAVLRVENLFTSTPKLVLQLLLALILLTDAYLLLTNWRQASQRLVQRLLNRVWGPRGPANRREKMFARAARDGLTLIGILWLALGTLELLVATVGF